jgi:hypothetical protein
LPQTPPTSSSIKTPENKEEDPDNPELTNEGDIKMD